MDPSPFAPRLRRAPLVALGLLALLVACSGKVATKDDNLCTPGNYVFCRCQDRQEGTKLCKDDGRSFGPCEPCESYDDLEGPGDPRPRPPPGVDGGEEEPEPGAVCGDAIVDDGEDCDDGNDDDTDGCDAKCRLAGLTPASTSACPGLEVHVWGGAHEPSLTSTTTGSGNRSLKTSCSNGTATSGAAGPDRVFKVTAHATGTMIVTTTYANYNVLLYASSSCPGATIAHTACANKVDGKGDETLVLPVESGQTYYVFVDGALPSSLDQALLQGSFRVTFSIP